MHVPTIQEELEANGSPAAMIETDEERSFFLIDIPCHPYFVNKEIAIDSGGVKMGIGRYYQHRRLQQVIANLLIFRVTEGLFCNTKGGDKLSPPF